MLQLISLHYKSTYLAREINQKCAKVCYNFSRRGYFKINENNPSYFKYQRSTFNLNMDYTYEPDHSQLLSIQEKEPFNAEPPSSALVEFPITPEDLVYCRNHGPVRQFDEDDYSLTIRGGKNGQVKLSMNDLRTLFPMTSIVAVLQVRLTYISYQSKRILRIFSVPV